MIKDDRYYPYGDYDGYTLVKGKCPKCGKPLYLHDGGTQGGIPHVECTNDECDYQLY
jgi:hypothetical protein